MDGLEVQLALSAADDVAILEPEDGVVLELSAVPWNLTLEGQSWTGTTMMPIMLKFVSGPPVWVSANTWSPSPPCELVVHQQPQAPPALLWQPWPFVDLTADERDDQDGDDNHY